MPVRLELADHATAAEQAKLREATTLLERAINDPRFAGALKQRFGELQAARILRRIRSGSEVYSPRADRVADLRVGFFDPRTCRGWGRHAAVSCCNHSLIRLNRAVFADHDAVRGAQTLGHMLACKMGFGGCVPQELGTIVERLARSERPPAPAPAPDAIVRPVPPPAPAPVPDPSVAPRPHPPAHYISAFVQGQEGNCVSIAAIKAAMAHFGPDAVFNRIDRVSGGYDVVMRDGFQVRVTDAELWIAMSVSHMKGRDSDLLAKANLMYAAMAKRAQLEGNDGWRNLSYSQACVTLNDGENYLEGAKWLGIERHVKVISPGQMDRYPAVVAASSRHAVFSTGGNVDHYGQSRPSARGGMWVEGWGRRIINAYAMV